MIIKIKKRFSQMQKTVKLILLIIIFVLFFVVALNSFVKVFISPSEDKIVCKEKSLATYSVSLKQNIFYESEKLPQGMNYIASLIDKIELSFDYLLSSSDLINYEGEYSIDAITRVYSENGNNVLFEKKETLVEPVKITKEKIADNSFKEDVIIDYEHFNDFAKKFKSSYFLTSDSDLSIVLNVHSKAKNRGYKGEIEFDSNSVVVIPLTEKTINISIDSNNIDNEKTLTRKNMKAYIIDIVVFALTLAISICLLYNLIKISISILKEKSKYEIQLNRILKENDSIVANIVNNINFDAYKIINTSSFEELRDVHDNLGIPILFRESIKGKLAYFYIINDQILYQFVLKDED